ncbi:uncharacterized protein LOC133880053 isoform X2 [Alnus glutinosa]|uniref:uncharacterized protein LOC133880053 isoform X2 n=1 Tax=Alnus glutinosa TaxID=3517 RepID=UPI002D776F3D|nr:uncharacterized protein LOC133880053 isoform X2 [Alnus glutinosa]
MGGSKEIAVFLIFFFYLPIFAISSPLQTALPSSSDSLQESHLGEKIVPRHGSKFGHASGHANGHGGHADGHGENGNNGGSQSPNAQGGTTFIPVYVAGAANNHHHHHCSANCTRNSDSVGVSILVAAILDSLIAHL